jgi:hypothetical protein
MDEGPASESRLRSLVGEEEGKLYNDASAAANVKGP